MKHWWIIIGLFFLVSCGKELKKSRFFTEGSCELCKNLIEKAALELPGVEKATWNFDDSHLTVHYDSTVINIDLLQQGMARSGFETQFYPADAVAREDLPKCCKERIPQRNAPEKLH